MKSQIYVNGEKVESFWFPGGEIHPRLPKFSGSHGNALSILQNKENVVHAKISCCSGQMALFLVIDAIKQASPADVIVRLPYFPYARQDRVCVPGEPFSANVFARLLNEMSPDRVIIADPHNEKLTREIVNNVEILKQEDIIPKELSFEVIRQKMVVVAPDEGATCKAKRFHDKLGIHSGVKLAQAKKTRDPETGQITGFECEPIEEGSDCLIIDDICDGGGTFIGLAKLLKEKFSVATVSVFTTHGIYSKGFSVFNDIIDNIWTTDSISQLDPEYVMSRKSQDGRPPYKGTFRVTPILFGE